MRKRTRERVNTKFKILKSHHFAQLRSKLFQVFLGVSQRLHWVQDHWGRPRTQSRENDGEVLVVLAI